MLTNTIGEEGFGGHDRKGKKKDINIMASLMICVLYMLPVSVDIPIIYII